jgi:predicted O-methyltransferase YrrM
MLTDADRREIARLWARKVEQDTRKLPKGERHRNLEPDSAELLCALASGLKAKAVVEIGGSSGVSTIALAAAMRATGGRVTSIEIEPVRQAESKETTKRLGLEAFIDYRLGDAADVLPSLAAQDLVLLDCEKDDYVRFFGLARVKPGGIVVADNVISHDIRAYQAHVRALPGVDSITLAVGKGLEVTRVASAGG